MADHAYRRTPHWRRAVIAGLLAFPVAALAGPNAAAALDRADLVTAPSSSGVSAVAFNPDGTLLASAYSNGTVRLWRVATGQVYGLVLQAGSGPRGGVTGVAFNPDGTLLASADENGTIGLWNPIAGRPSGSPVQAGAGVNAVAFSPDGALLASADANGAVQLWDTGTGQVHGLVLGAGRPSGRCHRGGVQPGRHAAGRRLQRRHRAAVGGGDRPGPRPGPSAGSGPSGRRDRGGVQPGRHAAGRRRRKRHDLAVEPRYRPAGSPLQAASPVTGVAFSPVGTLLAAASKNGTVSLWNPATGRPAFSPLHAAASVNGVAFSPDGKLLAGADASGAINVWNTPGPGVDWIIVLGSVLAIALAAVAVTITTREIWRAKLAGARRKLWKSCWS